MGKARIAFLHDCPFHASISRYEEHEPLSSKDVLYAYLLAFFRRVSHLVGFFSLGASDSVEGESYHFIRNSWSVLGAFTYFNEKLGLKLGLHSLLSIFLAFATRWFRSC